MPVTKSQIIPMIEDSFKKGTRAGQDISGTDIAFSQYTYASIYKTKSIPSKTCTPKQLWQRSLYRDADCLLRCMTPAQRSKWKQFYDDHPELWKAQSKKASPASSEARKLLSKDLSQRSLFFKMALKFNLEPFLSEYLKAKWHITSITKNDDGWTVEAKIIPKDITPEQATDYLDNRLIKIRW